MEMMDINEQLMELEMEFDATVYQNTLNTLQELEQSLYEMVAPILKNYSASSSNSEHLDRIKEYYLKKRYLLRIRENLDKFATR